MEYFDHTDITPEEAYQNGYDRVKPIIAPDLSRLPSVVMHPTMKNVSYFMIEYARALQMDMLKYPKKYKSVSFDYVYEKMATAIVNNKAIVAESVPIQHACRAAGIPATSGWIQAYIWFDQFVGVRVKTWKPPRERKMPVKFRELLSKL